MFVSKYLALRYFHFSAGTDDLLIFLVTDQGIRAKVRHGLVDGDFRRVVEAVQRQGVKVTVVSTMESQPPMIADELRRQRGGERLVGRAALVHRQVGLGLQHQWRVGRHLGSAAHLGRRAVVVQQVVLEDLDAGELRRGDRLGRRFGRQAELQALLADGRFEAWAAPVYEPLLAWTAQCETEPIGDAIADAVGDAGGTA